jgi:hypothetical protein
VLLRLLRLPDGKWHVQSHYPTQAKSGLEWGTQRFLLMERGLRDKVMTID